MKADLVAKLIQMISDSSYFDTVKIEMIKDILDAWSDSPDKPLICE